MAVGYTDDEVMRVLWLSQLTKIASNVLIRRVGERFRVCADDDDSFIKASYHRIGKDLDFVCEVPPKVLQFKIRELLSRGRLTRHKDGFYIDIPAAREAFDMARKHWIRKNIDAGPINSVTLDGRIDILAFKLRRKFMSDFRINQIVNNVEERCHGGNVNR